MLKLNWTKCADGESWCQLENVNLADVKTAGVYVIWHAGQPARTVRVGQGDISARLSAHRGDPAILAHRKHGKLLVTWASVPVAQRNGVERYLADHYRPLVGDAFPNCLAIQVNLVA